MDSPDPNFEGRLAALRLQLKKARDERGGCPSWEDLRADLLPGGKNRPGRAERLAHRAICPYCETHVKEWERSVDHAADTLAAVERGVVRGLAGGARGLVRKLARGRERVPRDEAPSPPEAAPRPEAAPPAEVAPRPEAPPRPEVVRRPARATSAPATARAVDATPLGRLLVVEMLEDRKPPE